MEDFLSIKEAAEYLNVSQDALRKWDKEGKLKPFKTPGGHRKYTVELLNDFIGNFNETNKYKITKQQAIDELGYETITKNPFDLLKCVDASWDPKEPKCVFVGGSINEKWSVATSDICKWLSKYKELNNNDRLLISDLVITNDYDRLSGNIFVINGLNGMTKVSSQSLKHIMDIISYLEDYYGARAFLSYVSSHSDVYYYLISFVIWEDLLNDAKEKHLYGNLRPLYHWD